MRQAIDEVSSALAVLKKPAPFTVEAKASEFMEAVFELYFKHIGTPNLMSKTDYHTIARFVPYDMLDAEISEKLDAILRTAARAHPGRY